jgi:hypothetical protein
MPGIELFAVWRSNLEGPYLIFYSTVRATAWRESKRRALTEKAPLLRLVKVLPP